MKLPRAQLRVGAEAAPINIGALIAPSEAASQATSEITHGLASVFSALSEKEKETRHLVFQEQLSNAAFQLKQKQYQTGHDLIQKEDSNGLRNFIANDTKPIVDELASQFSDPDEFKKAHTFLTETANHGSLDLMHAGVSHNIQVGQNALINDLTSIATSIDPTNPATFMESNQQTATRIAVAKSQGLMGDVGEEKTRLQWMQQNSASYVKQINEHAEGMFATPGQQVAAIRYLETQLKEAPPAIKEAAGREFAAQAEGTLGTTLQKLRYYLQLQNRGAATAASRQAFDDMKAGALRGIEPDPKIYASLPYSKQKQIDDSWEKGQTQKVLVDTISNAIKGQDVSGEPVDALFVKGGEAAQEAAATVLKNEITNNRLTPLTPVQQIDAFADAATNVGRVFDYQKNWLTGQLRDAANDPTKGALMLRYFRKVNPAISDNGMTPSQNAFMQKFSELETVYTGPGIDPMQATARAYQDALQISPLSGEIKTASGISQRYKDAETYGSGLLSLEPGGFGKARPIVDAFTAKYSALGIPPDQISRAIQQQGPILQQATKDIYVHDTHGDVTKISSDMPMAAVKAVHNLSDDYGFDQFGNYVRGTPLALGQTKAGRDQILKLMDETAGKISAFLQTSRPLSKNDLQFIPNGINSAGIPTWGVGVVTSMGLLPIKGEFKVSDIPAPAQKAAP